MFQTIQVFWNMMLLWSLHGSSKKMLSGVDDKGQEETREKEVG
jgi:hypothetical protein